MELSWEQKQEIIKSFYIKKGLKEKFLKYVNGVGQFSLGYEHFTLPFSDYQSTIGINPDDFNIEFVYGSRILTPKENIF